MMPWNMRIDLDSPACVAVQFDVRTYRSPLRIEKTMTLHRYQSALHFREILTNENVAGAKVRVVEAEPTTRLESGEEYVWPWVQGRNGEAIDLSRIPGPETRSHYGKPFSAEAIRKSAGAAEEINYGNAVTGKVASDMNFQPWIQIVRVLRRLSRDCGQGAYAYGRKQVARQLTQAPTGQAI